MQAQSKTEWATELRTAITFDEVIFLLERQKDVDALRNIKLVAACDPEGAGNEFRESLRNADVVIISGSNQAGRDHAHSFVAQYEVRDGAAVWTRTEIVDAERARVVAALKDGMSIRETAEALGIHRSKVERLVRKAREARELPPAANAAE